jgi:hypothetical protein
MKIYNLCRLPNPMKAIKSKGDVVGCTYSTHGRFKYTEILVCNFRSMTHLVKPRHKLEDAIK